MYAKFIINFFASLLLFSRSTPHFLYHNPTIEKPLLFYTNGRLGWRQVVYTVKLTL